MQFVPKNGVHRVGNPYQPDMTVSSFTKFVSFGVNQVHAYTIPVLKVCFSPKHAAAIFIFFQVLITAGEAC